MPFSGVKKSGGDGDYQALLAKAWSNQSILSCLAPLSEKGLCATVRANPQAADDSMRLPWKQLIFSAILALVAVFKLSLWQL